MDFLPRHSPARYNSIIIIIIVVPLRGSCDDGTPGILSANDDDDNYCYLLL